jgi:hypothetical protein
MFSPRRAATPLALVVLALAAIAYEYFVDRGTVSDADREARLREVFPTFQIDLVHRIELSHGQETLVLERPEGPGATWAMTSPRREPAEASAVDSLLRDLELARRARFVSNDTQIGEVRARGRVTVGRVQYVFTLGGDAPSPRGGAYMTVLGEPPFVVEQSLKAQLLRTADSYRVRSLVRYSQSEIRRIERTNGATKLTLERVGDTFRVGSTSGPRASRAALDRIFDALADIRAETFLEDGEGDRATSHLVRTVVIVPRDETQPHVTIAFGDPCPTPPGEVVVAVVGPTRTSACVARGSLEALDVSSDDLVDKSLLSARADEIEEIDLSSGFPGGPRLNLARRGTGWHLRAPQDRELTPEETDSANTFVSTMAGAQAMTVESSTSARRQAVHTRATFVRTGAGSSEIVEISAPDASGVASARRLEDGALLRVSRAVARRFDPHVVVLRARAAWTAPFDPASVVRVDDTCTPDAQRIDLVDGRWRMRMPAGQAVDVAYTMDLVESVAHAKADGWIAEADDGTFGLDASACDVTLTLATRDADAGADSRTLVFGAGADGDTYARTLDGPEVFLAPPGLLALARHPAIDRSAFRIEASPGLRVELKKAHTTIELSASGGAFSRAGREEASDDPVGAALVATYARDAVHAGPPAPSEGFDLPTLEILLAGRGAPSLTRRIVIGAPIGKADDGYFARVSGVNATFAVDGRTVEALLAGW